MSVPAHNSTVVSLDPTMNAAASHNPLHGSPPELAVPQVVRVLLVEDDEDDFVITRDLLRQATRPGHIRYELEWAPGYDQAVQRLAQGSHDVCLVDYYLGERNGISFLVDCRQRGVLAPIILLTGLGDDEIDLLAMNTGAADFLSKAQLTGELLERSIRYALAQKKAEDRRIHLLAMEAARNQAEAANHSKDQFMATLSHELRTPLTPVLMVLASLEADAELPQQYRADIQLIRRNIELEARLIDDLLDLTRIARGKLSLHEQPVDVHALVDHIARSCRESETGSKRQALEVSLGAQRHHVLGDSARLAQIIWNLVRNAVKFTPEGGTIRIMTCNPSDDRLQIEVQDTGIGIDSEVLPRIFDAFEQGHHAVTRTFGGLGLGLAISKALVQMHGGRISVASPGKNRGATFTVELATMDAPLAHHGNSPGVRSSSQRPLSILLVEDHAATARVMARLLRGEQHDVHTASDVATAKAIASERRFDLVISDLGLPDGSGLELMQHLVARFNLQGIALSGYGMEEDLRQSRAAGFSEHLVKPVSIDQLCAAMHRVTARTAPADA